MGKITVSELLGQPNVPSSGLRSLYPKSDGWYDLDAQGVEKKVFSSSTYGSNYMFAQSTTRKTNTTSSFTNYITLNYPSGLAVSGQKYEVEFHALTNMSTTSKDHVTRVTLDGATLEQEIYIEHKDSGSKIRLPVTYKYVIDGVSLNTNGGTISLEFKSEKSGHTASIHSCTLTFKRVL